MTPETRACLKYVELAMERLESYASGGIGADGYTLGELEAFEAEGGVAEDDSCFHDVQFAWRLLELAKGACEK